MRFLFSTTECFHCYMFLLCLVPSVSHSHLSLTRFDSATDTSAREAMFLMKLCLRSEKRPDHHRFCYTLAFQLPCELVSTLEAGLGCCSDVNYAKEETKAWELSVSLARRGTHLASEFWTTGEDESQGSTSELSSATSRAVQPYRTTRCYGVRHERIGTARTPVRAGSARTENGTTLLFLIFSTFFGIALWHYYS